MADSAVSPIYMSNATIQVGGYCFLLSPEPGRLVSLAPPARGQIASALKHKFASTRNVAARCLATVQDAEIADSRAGYRQGRCLGESQDAGAMCSGVHSQGRRPPNSMQRTAFSAADAGRYLLTADERVTVQLEALNYATNKIWIWPKTIQDLVSLYEKDYLNLSKASKEILFGQVRSCETNWLHITQLSITFYISYKQSTMDIISMM